MENQENQNYFNEPTPQENVPNQQSQYSYRGAGTGRKESPYADSPYVMNHQPREEYRSQPEHSQYQYRPGYQMPQKPKKKKTGFGKKLLAAILAVALVAGSCGITAALVNDHWENRTNEMVTRFNEKIDSLQTQIDAATAAATGSTVSGSPVAAGGLSPSQVYAKNVNAVVAISNQTTTNFFGQISETASSGSGFIISEDGYVISNHHVVSGANTLTVIMHDGSEYNATLIGSDETNDLALLKVEATGLPYVTIGSSDALIVGDQVVAIGNPLGELTNSLTVGYVSAKERMVSTDGTVITMMQTDAAINPGNSGGPLFNMKGEVVGITTAKYSGTTSSGASIEGIGFAIPIDDVMELLDDLKAFGYVKGAYMAVMVGDMDSQTAALAETYGLPVGPIIQSTEPGGAANRAGIQKGDIVTHVGDTRVQSVTELTRALRDYEPGDTSTITVYRSGERHVLEITFDERPAQTPVQETVPESEYGPNRQEEYEEWFNPFFGWGD